MITLDHEVLCSDEQMEFIIEGMRNPMNSWERSDSIWGCYCYDGEMKDCDICNHIAPDDCTWNPNYILGKNDLNLMTRLSKAGRDHRKYMRMIPVMIRVTAPLYWWKEFDTYKIGTVGSSTSTMHKIAAKEFTILDFSTEHLMSGRVKSESIYDENGNDITMASNTLLGHVINHLNIFRKLYLETKDKLYWYQLIQLLPSSYNQTRNLVLNYEVLSNIYASRRNHKLDEWHVFCDWIEALPYSYLITGGEPEQYGKVRAASTYGYYWQSSTDDYVDPRIARAAKVVTKAKLAPSDLEDGRDDTEEQGKSIGEAVNNIVNKAMGYINDEAYRKMNESITEFLDTKPKDSSVAIVMASDIMCGNTFGKMNANEHEICSDVIKECENIALRPNIADMTLSDIYKNFRLHNEDSDNDKPQGDCNC
nr:MAG TPA: hypothetical protein [Caudoviricetes sp.]